MPRPFHHAHNSRTTMARSAVPSGPGWSPSFQSAARRTGSRCTSTPRPAARPPRRRAGSPTNGNDANTGSSRARRSGNRVRADRGRIDADDVRRSRRAPYDYNSWAGQTQAAPNLIGYGGARADPTQPTGLSWSSAGSGAYSTTFATAP